MQGSMERQKQMARCGRVGKGTLANYWNWIPRWGKSLCNHASVTIWHECHT